MNEKVEQIQELPEQVEVIDHIYGWIWQMAEVDGVLPPFCVELTLHDGNRFYLHSIPEKDDTTQSMVLRVWDVQAFDEQEMRDLRASISEHARGVDLKEPAKLHSKLDYADVRLHLGNINYAIEWNDLAWPREERPQFGLIQK